MTAAQPTISIVTPTYRRADLLDELLAAAVPQVTANAGRAEMVIVDNCPDGSAAPTVARHEVPGLRYVHEPRSGVVHARNAGVAAASGCYVLFLDDDEIPGAGWLEAFLSAADRGDAMAIGRIVARYRAPVPPHLAGLLSRLYARNSPEPAGADVTDRIRLGTGNALFRKDLFDPAVAFDLRFNRTGGEDVRLIHGLLARGVRVRWVPDGWVEEEVPAARMTPAALGKRRFTQGQIRCLLIDARGGPARLPRLALWMSVGLAQVLFYRARGLLAGLRGQETDTWAIKAQGGLGKLRWRQRAAVSNYAGERQPAA